VIAALLGADEFGFGTAELLAIGCVMARQCHLNTCPVGIATQNETLRARFTGKPEMVETYFRAVAEEVSELLARIGATSIDQIIGRTDCLRARNQDAHKVVEHLLAAGKMVKKSSGLGGARPNPSRWSMERIGGSAVRLRRFRITTDDRAVGACLSGELARMGNTGEQESLRYEFTGSAGQSFGAFLVQGVDFNLQGEANDYVGKGLCGGTIIISAGPQASTRGDVLAGNTVLYGATSGELYLSGRAGERFAVRNSGALAVVEGVGHHGCEYMTAGIVVVLGPCGPNFGAGMTGGLAYVLKGRTRGFYNQQSLSTGVIQAWEESWLREVITRHWRYTGSPRAAKLLIAGEGLPFVRLQPVQPPCSVQQSWSPFLPNTPRSVTFKDDVANTALATI
jgi:glutamate synthase domain-containing protein 3